VLSIVAEESAEFEARTLTSSYGLAVAPPKASLTVEAPTIESVRPDAAGVALAGNAAAGWVARTSEGVVAAKALVEQAV
jgi:hypothetical protein